MSKPALKDTKYTYQDYSAWEDDTERWELIEGYPYSMSPAPNRRHQTILGRLFVIFSNYLEGKKCKVFVAPFDVKLPEKNEMDQLASNVVQPDLSVFCQESKLDDQGACGAPDFVVEVLSPASLKKDTDEKRLLYERFGVKEYWIVNPDLKTIDVYLLNRKNKFSLSRTYPVSEKLKVRLFPELQLDLSELFKG